MLIPVFYKNGLIVEKPSNQQREIKYIYIYIYKNKNKKISKQLQKQMAIKAWNKREKEIRSNGPTR